MSQWRRVACPHRRDGPVKRPPNRAICAKYELTQPGKGPIHGIGRVLAGGCFCLSAPVGQRRQLSGRALCAGRQFDSRKPGIAAFRLHGRKHNQRFHADGHGGSGGIAVLGRRAPRYAVANDYRSAVARAVWIVRVHEALPPDMLWQTIIALQLLVPYGLFAYTSRSDTPDAFFSYDQNALNGILKTKHSP